MADAAPLAAEEKLCCNHGQLAGMEPDPGEGIQDDYSNASRTQLFNIETLAWDGEVCALFGIPAKSLPQVTGSDGVMGIRILTTQTPIPIRGAGDSHGAVRPGCLKRNFKTTYGTGSSVMMNIGEKPVLSEKVVTSLAWHMMERPPRAGGQHQLHGGGHYLAEGQP